MVLTLMLLIPAVFQAQGSFGIRAGLNASNISFDLLPARGERIGFHAGIFADLPVLPGFLSLQPELSYSVQGAAFEPLDVNRQQIKMDYVDFLLPVAFKLGPIDGKHPANYMFSSRQGRANFGVQQKGKRCQDRTRLAGLAVRSRCMD